MKTGVQLAQTKYRNKTFHAENRARISSYRTALDAEHSLTSIKRETSVIYFTVAYHKAHILQVPAGASTRLCHSLHRFPLQPRSVPG